MSAVEEFLKKYPLITEGQVFRDLKEYFSEKGWTSLAEAAELYAEQRFADGIEKISEADFNSADEERRNLSILLWAQPLILFVVTLAEKGGLKEEADLFFTLIKALKDLSGKYKLAGRNTGSFLTLVLLEEFIKRVQERELEEAYVLLMLSRETATLSENEDLIRKISEIISEIESESSEEQEGED